MEEMREEFQTVMELAGLLTEKAINAKTEEERLEILEELKEIFDRRSK